MSCGQKDRTTTPPVKYRCEDEIPDLPLLDLVVPHGLFVSWSAVERILRTQQKLLPPLVDLRHGQAMLAGRLPTDVASFKRLATDATRRLAVHRSMGSANSDVIATSLAYSGPGVEVVSSSRGAYMDPSRLPREFQRCEQGRTAGIYSASMRTAGGSSGRDGMCAPSPYQNSGLRWPAPLPGFERAGPTMSPSAGLTLCSGTWHVTSRG